MDFCNRNVFRVNSSTHNMHGGMFVGTDTIIPKMLIGMTFFRRVYISIRKLMVNPQPFNANQDQFEGLPGD